MSRWLFIDYIPSFNSSSFLERLNGWVTRGVPADADRKTLLELVLELTYIGHQERLALFQLAFHGPIARWLLDAAGIALDDANLDTEFERAVRGCWFGSITDMDIGTFCRVNGIRGQELRPDWNSLATFASVDRLRDWMRLKNFARIVLIEDFVGSGRQAEDAILWLGENFGSVPILFCPILICREGSTRIAKLVRRFSEFSFAPLFETNERMILSVRPRLNEPTLHQRIRELAIRVHPLVRGGRPTPRNPLGFDSTGALVVMHTNCPNNAPPLIHHDSSRWTALFPRAARY
jgi:hypothetical protein